MTVYENAVSITSKQGYRLAMGPVRTPGHGETVGWRRGAYFGSQWRASFPNGWGPTCWHSTPEAAIDCLDNHVSEVMRNA